jgi:exopolyphosphatase / guanosine-5'-triphosphate,3'-diphosphate pyrophosphatase
LHRSRRDREFHDLRLKIGEDSLKLIFPDGWLDDHPLNYADLTAEKSYLKDAGFKLKFK